MGVADNRSYKNEYHFTDDSRPTSEQYPSIEKDPKVNTTIKKNPYRSNVEIEGDEIVLQPDLSALFIAKGKRHSKGGMDVLLKPDSFVFSDYKELEIDEDEAEDFELKEGGTPAKTLKKNVNVKHYNTLVQNITNPYKDDLAKKSSEKMLEKYIKMLGNIAYIQESKKGFPQGLPDFSLGTAPIENEELEDQIDENKQYMKGGGMIKNPYRMQKGGTLEQMVEAQKKLFELQQELKKKKEEDFKKSTEQVSNVYLQNNISRPTSPNPNISSSTAPITTSPIASPTQRQDRYMGKRPPYPDSWTNYYDNTQKIQYNSPDWITPSQFYSVPGLIDYMKTLDKSKGVDWDMNKADDGWWGWRHEAALKKFFPNGLPKATPFNITPDQKKELLQQVGKSAPLIAPATKSKDDISGPKVEEQEYSPQGSVKADWKFTPWQKVSQAYNWAQYAGVDRYMPFRSRYNATYVDPALVNPEQAIGDMKGMTNQQSSALSTLSPILRNAQASGNFGQLLNQVAGVRSQYDNQNAQILNQTRQYNNQTKNNESMINMQNDQQYYTQAVEGRKNFDNMRTYTANNAMNNVLRDVETNQKLAYNLLTQNDPAYTFDWRNGEYLRTNKSILDVASDSKSDWYTQVATQLMEKFKSGQKLEAADVNFLKAIVAKDFKPSSNSFNPFEMKKGGKKKNPYK